MANTFQLSLAPQQLWQAINPWTFNQQGAQFGLINIDLGSTSQPQVEQAILDKVGSYGKQLGHIDDALQVLIRHLDTRKLTTEETHAIDVLKVELVKIRRVKHQAQQSK
jgi:hypothetical protein